MFRKLALSAFVISATASSLFAQSFNKAKMDSLMDAISKNNKGMGSVAIAQNGKILYTKSLGYSYIGSDKKQAADYTTKYRIGSITKMFTATMIFQLAEEHKLTLKTPLDTWFPKIPNAKKITISDMLCHHSGIHNFTDDTLYTKWNEKAHTEAEMLEIIIRGGSDFAPGGTTAEYSNANYVLLGYIIEKVTKSKYKDELEKRITSKVGLANTYYGGNANTSKNEAFSYSLSTISAGWEQQSQTDMSVPGGAGAIVSTPSDLTLFIYSLFSGKLISKASLDQMTTIKDKYGMGIFQVPFGSKKGFGHTGGIDCFASSLGYFPGDELAVAYCSNGNVMPINDIIIGALSIFYNRPYKIPDFKTVEVSEATLKSYTGNYSSAQMPLKINVTLKDKTLYAQATGQGAFPLNATNDTIFEFDQAGIVMVFDAAKNTLQLRQGGGSYDFVKDK